MDIINLEKSTKEKIISGEIVCGCESYDSDVILPLKKDNKNEIKYIILFNKDAKIKIKYSKKAKGSSQCKKSCFCPTCYSLKFEDYQEYIKNLEIKIKCDKDKYDKILI
jgi:hypothetical protein